MRHIGHHVAFVFHVNAGGHGNFVRRDIHVFDDAADADQRIKEKIISSALSMIRPAMGPSFLDHLQKSWFDLRQSITYLTEIHLYINRRPTQTDADMQLNAVAFS